MWLREQRVPRVSVGHFVHDDQHAEVSATQVHPFEVAGDYDAQLAVSLRVPDCRHLYWRPDHDDDHGTLWLVDPGSGAWAEPAPPPEVPRPLRSTPARATATVGRDRNRLPVVARCRRTHSRPVALHHHPRHPAHRAEHRVASGEVSSSIRLNARGGKGRFSCPRSSPACRL
jgi:hypothetical protein